MWLVKYPMISNTFDAIDGLSGSLWPLHVKPLDDELLSSWIIRLAHAHGFKVETLCSILFGPHSTIWNRDIDKLAPEEVGSSLQKAMGISESEFEKLALRSYKGTLFEKLNANGKSRWIVPIGVYHRKRKRNGLMLCPQCLLEDDVPYYRRAWRLAFVTECTRHKIQLIDCCPNCDAPIIPHRADMGAKNLYPAADLRVHCWQCGIDYRHYSNEQASDHNLLDFQELLETTLELGYLSWDNNPSMYSVIFFDGLREMLSGVLSKESLKRIKYGPLSNKINGELLFEDYPLYLRREVLSMVAEFTRSWPESFKKIIHSCELRYSDLQGNTKNRRYWYERVIRKESFNRQIALTNNERQSIIRYVESIKGYVDPKTVKEITGRNVSEIVINKSKKRVSDDLYEDLLVSLDHEIASTLDKSIRRCLIRDKIMFACGRQLSLSLHDLSCLTINSFNKLVPESGVLDFTSVANTPERIKAWINWYCQYYRYKLQPASGCRYIFTSEQTGTNLKRSIIGIRFNRAVSSAGLERHIKNYSYWH